MIPLTQINSLSTNTQTKISHRQDDIEAEVYRLLHAAVINRRFREKLLTNPTNCIETGFCGESFNFPKDLIKQLKSVNARSLDEFTCKVMQLINTIPVPELAPVYVN